MACSTATHQHFFVVRWGDSTTEDIDAYLYDATNPTCGDKTTFLDDGYTSDDNEFLSWSNSTGASVDVIIEVSAWLGGTTQVICDDYDLVISVAPDPCLAGLDDSFEENDSCGAAVVLPTGSTTGLTLSPCRCIRVVAIFPCSGNCGVL